METLARIGERLGGGRIVDAVLLGRSLGDCADLVTVVGTDSNAAPGEPRRITRVDRVGYAVDFSDGSRRAVVKALVLIAP